MRIGVGLSIPELATRGGRAFSPASLFTSGVTGAWYDPSDYSTLFQDSAGTTPVTAVEQPVGLMLDKSQGLVLGSELITPEANRDFSSDTGYWTKYSVTISGGLCNFSGLVAGVGLARSGFATAGKYYEVRVDVASYTQGGIRIYVGGNRGVLINATGTYTQRILAGSTDTLLIFETTGASTTLSLDNVSVKEVLGNHASQATPTSCPVLRARYNLLTYSEQFDNAVWQKNNSTVTTNTTIAPDGATTADTLKCVALGSDCWAAQSNSSGVVYTGSCYFKYIDNPWMAFSNSGYFCYFNIQTGTVGTVGNGSATITDVGNGWYRCTWTQTDTTQTGPLRIRMAGANGSPTTTPANASVFIWGAQNVTGSSAGTYQRIAAATDYATAGFLPYLYFITDDSFGTNSINFSATDKMAVCAGVTKLSDASAQIVCELSATSSAGNNGSFAIISALSPSNYAFYLYGNALASRTATTYASPVTNVVSVKYDISQSTVPNEIAPQINGAVPTLADAGGAGTGNFGNYPLYIGRRNNATLPFNGNLYQLIVCGKALSASELASTEAYVNSKTGAY